MRRLILLSLSLALAGCGPASEGSSNSVSGPPALTTDRLSELQALADASCLCEREKGLAAGPVCAEEYNMALFDHEPSISLAEEVVDADPLAQTVVTLAGDTMIVERYDYGACSAEEAAQRKEKIDKASEF